MAADVQSIHNCIIMKVCLIFLNICLISQFFYILVVFQLKNGFNTLVFLNHIKWRCGVYESAYLYTNRQKTIIFSCCLKKERNRTEYEVKEIRKIEGKTNIAEEPAFQWEPKISFLIGRLNLFNIVKPTKHKEEWETKA